MGEGIDLRDMGGKPSEPMKVDPRKTRTRGRRKDVMSSGVLPLTLRMRSALTVEDLLTFSKD